MSDPVVTPRLNRCPPDTMNPAADAKSRPCATCPFRTANRNLVTGLGDKWDTYFTEETHRAVWEGTWDAEHPASALSNGGLNHCHQTHAHACAGTLVLQQRELLRAVTGQRTALTKRGVERVAARIVNRDQSVLPAWIRRPYERATVPLRALREVATGDLLALMHPALRDDAIGSHFHALPSRAEREAWNPESTATRTMFHGTLETFRESIKAGGLRTPQSRHGGHWRHDTRGAFLTLNRDVAIGYAQSNMRDAGAGAGLLLTVEVPVLRLPVSRLRSRARAYVTALDIVGVRFDHIPPDWIVDIADISLDD